jgi:hypothetical protein
VSNEKNVVFLVIRSVHITKLQGVI